jgi:hypothetical protein
VKPRSFIIAAGALATAACFSLPPVTVKVEIPGVPALPPVLFTEIIVTDFRSEATPPDFAVGRELQGYLAAELGRSFKGAVSRLDLSRDGLTVADDPASWKRTAAGRVHAVFLTGSAGLVGQTRKALEKKRIPVDGPFNIDRRGLIEQRRWTLSADVSIVSAATGETLYRSIFREERDYVDLEKPAEFAFSELAARIRNRLFPILFGAPTTEERALLRR